MEILWHGQTCFTLKGESATLVTDPYSGIGLTLPTLKADVVTVSKEDPQFNTVSAVEGAPRVFNWPGEYEASGVLMMAIAFSGNLIFHFEIDGIRFLHLGTVDTKLTGEMLEQLGEVDVLLIPVGGAGAFNAKGAHEVMEQIEPRIVIPMHYHVDGLKEKVEGVESFLKEVGGHMEPQDKFVIKGRSSLPEETTQFIVLNPQLG